jgi:hypothetical protein
MGITYQHMIDELAKHNVSAYFQQDDQLVISRQGDPVWPGPGNSFWISCPNGSWHICTWAPVCYRVPDETGLLKLCLAFLDEGGVAQPNLPLAIVQEYNLSILDDAEASSLFGFDLTG